MASPSSIPLRIIILAAGQGQRLKSKTPKVLQPLGGLPLLGHVLRTAFQLDPAEVVVVTSPQSPAVIAYLQDHFPQVKRAIQPVPQGTGHGVLCARSSLASLDGDVLILYGDVPLVRSASLEKMGEVKRSLGAEGVVLGMESRETQSYGRLITTGNGSFQDPRDLERIVEFKEATAEERRVTFCNSGMLQVSGSSLFSWLEEVKPSSQTQEYYLTDIIKIGRTHGKRWLTVGGEESELAGINTREELQAAEAWIQDRYRQEALGAGAWLQGPETIFFSHDTQVAEDVKIGPYVVFGPGVILEEGCHILPFSHLEETRVGPGAHVGPFARLRGHTHIQAQGDVGNFVELKNTQVGRGSKIKHLSYLGDTTLGEKVNVGAGAITANYDGFHKWQTHMGDEVMVGVNSVLVAPVRIGDQAIIGAGSIITQDVGSQELALSRGVQQTYPGKAPLLREKFKTRKKE